MLDSHTIPKEAWGVHPYFEVSGLHVPAYSLFVAAGVLVGVLLYLDELRRGQPSHEQALPILLASLVGGVVGAKLPYLVWNLSLYLKGVRDPEILFSGRTILGGLIGGTLAVRLVKHRLGLRLRKGDYMVSGIAAGIALGRVGCFLRGCCCGTPTTLPWGVDFGDGLHRHPTELYETVFCLGWFFYARWQPKTDTGRLFDRFMLTYFGVRFLMEFIRTEPTLFIGLTAFQLVCLPVVGWLCFKQLKQPSPWTPQT